MLYLRAGGSRDAEVVSSIFPDRNGMGVVNGIACGIDKAGTGGPFFGLDPEDNGGCQRLFSFFVLPGMEVDILVFKDNTGDLVVFPASGEFGFGNGKRDQATGLGGMRRLNGFDTELLVRAGVLDGAKVKPGFWMLVSVMRRVGLVVQDELDSFAFRGHVADEPGRMGWKFYVRQIALQVGDQAIDVIVFIAGVADDGAPDFQGVLFCFFHCMMILILSDHIGLPIQGKGLGVDDLGILCGDDARRQHYTGSGAGDCRAWF